MAQTPEHAAGGGFVRRVAARSLLGVVVAVSVGAAWSSPVPSTAQQAAASTAPTVSGSAAGGRLVLAQVGGFDDVADDAYYSGAVSALAAAGVFAGTECEDGLCPGEPIDRKTMAVWIVRVLDGQDPPAVAHSRFADVDAASFHGPLIERMVELGVTVGCGDGTNFCPDGTVTRGHMAVFLSRAYNLEPGPDPGFGDVPADAWYADAVARLAHSGITVGCGDRTNFCPDRDVTRGEMATFLHRGLGVATQTTTAPDGAATYKTVATSSSHGCAILTDDTITCWGDYRDGKTDPPAGTYKTLAAGSSHNCAIATDNTITCWGRDRSGETDAPPGTYKTVATGSDHNCAIATDNTITCWGDDDDGKTDPPAGTYKALAAGDDHSCAIATDNTITCWGNNWAGRADAPSGTYKTLAAVDHYNCAIATDNTITCWGAYCRTRTGGSVGCPWMRGPSGTYKALAAGSDHSCAIATDNTITCWGNNDHGQADPPPGTHKTLAAGFNHNCAIATDNTITCWGNNDHGQADPPPGTYKTLAAGWPYSCAIATDNTITCWGYNARGQADPPETELEVSATRPLAPLDLSARSAADHVSRDVLDFDMINAATGATVNLRWIVQGRTPLLLWLYSPY